MNFVNMVMKAFGAVTVSMPLFLLEANAADIRLAGKFGGSFDDTFDQVGCQIRIEGEIKAGDFEKLKNLYATGINADASGGEVPGVGPNICVTGPGGTLSEAIKIARFIKDNHGATIIPPYSKCESACSIVFMAGNTNEIPDRNIYSSSKLGFHAPALILNGSNYQSEEVMKAYDLAIKTVAKVSELNILPPFAMTLFSSTPNSEMRYLENVSDLQNSQVGLIRKGAGYFKYSQLDATPSSPLLQIIKNVCNFSYRSKNFGRKPIFRERGFSYEKENWIEEYVKIKETERSSFNYIVEGEVFIWEAEEHASGCKVSFQIAKDMSAQNVTVDLGSGKSYLTPFALWPPFQKIDSIEAKALTRSGLLNLIRANAEKEPPTHCALGTQFSKVINVSQFVNIRAGASLADRVVTTANRGQRVQVVQPNSWWFKETRRGRQCSEICSRYHQTPTNSTLASQAKQCVDDKEIWTKVRVNGREGYVSVYFLEAQ